MSARGRARGIPFTLVAPSGIITRGSMYAAALVRSDSPIKTGADLNGKTFAVPAIKDLNQIAAMAWVDQNGGDSRTLKFIELSAPATIAAIEDGRVDAGNVGTPTLTMALEGGKTRIMAQVFDAFGNRFANTGWFTTTDYAKSNPDTVTRFATVMRQAAQLANSHHAETAALLADYFKGDPKVYAHGARGVRRNTRSARHSAADRRGGEVQGDRSRVSGARDDQPARARGEAITRVQALALGEASVPSGAG